MRFRQIDEIIELQPGKRLVGKRTLRAEEDYLRDHFPKFPVMPGVMMLEALYQAAMWMVRTGDDFQYPLVFLREARAVKFADFLSPGETLVIEVEAIKTDGSLVTVKAQGRKGERPSVQARLVIERRDLAPHQRGASSFDIRQRVKKQFVSYYGDPLAISGTTVT